MRILLIEDEKRFGQSLKKLLEGESYAVNWCMLGEEGYKEGIFEEYDAAIVDVGLPDISGREVVSRWREQNCALPVLMLTALGQLKDKVVGLDSGADDYVVKPVMFDELLARLRSLLRRPPVVNATVFTCGTLEVNSTRREVTRAGKSVHLSLKEYALLEYLIRNVSLAVSRQTLMDHVWDNQLDPFSNTVDVHIGYLRQKIDKAFPREKPVIHTVRGIGYKIAEL